MAYATTSTPVPLDWSVEPVVESLLATLLGALQSSEDFAEPFASSTTSPSLSPLLGGVTGSTIFCWTEILDPLTEKSHVLHKNLLCALATTYSSCVHAQGMPSKPLQCIALLAYNCLPVELHGHRHNIKKKFRKIYLESCGQEKESFCPLRFQQDKNDHK